MISPTTLVREHVGGWECLALANDRVALQIFPELGGRVASMRDRRSGREWLWAPSSDRRLFRNRPGDNFAASPHVGLDECIPTVASCRWRGRTLPDHGEIWTLPWAVDEEALASGVVALRVDLPLTPLRFERRLRLTGNSVRFAYRLKNLGVQPEEYLWAMHPLFTIQRGDVLELPPDVASIKLECAGGKTIDEDGAVWPWPETFMGVRLDRLELPDTVTGYLKAFATPREGRVRLHNDAAGESLTICWDVSLNPSLGLWLTRGGYRGWHHVAVEPSSGAPGSLELAVQAWGQAARLAPQETREWWVDWIIGA